MRLAIMADIHGNLPAFEAALDHIAQQKVDQTIIAGDICVGGPDSAGCWRLAQSLGCPILRGNHERYIAHYGTPQASPEWSSERFTPLHWALKQFSEQERQEIGALPLNLRLAEAPDLFIVHASGRGDHDTISAFTPEEQLHRMFPNAPERWIVRAHNHIGQVRLWENGMIITCGSVGLPLDSHPTAQYLLLERDNHGWRVLHQSVAYDLDKAIQRYYDTGYLEATGPMGFLFLRELATASHQIVPFLRFYASLSKDFDAPLVEALEKFLNGDWRKPRCKTTGC